MALISKLKFKNRDYFVVFDSTSSKQEWYLLSPYTKQDLVRIELGENTLQQVLLNSNFITSKYLTDEYILESQKIDILSGKVERYGTNRVIGTVIEAFNSVLVYQFKSDLSQDIVEKELVERTISKKDENGNIVKEKKLKEVFITKSYNKDENAELLFVRKKNKFLDLKFSYNGVHLDFNVEKSLKFTNFTGTYMDWTDDFNGTANAILKIRSVDALASVYDLSWYRYPDGKLKKDYSAVHSNVEFETNVIDEIVKEYWECMKRGEKLVLAFDTETTGLNICYLKDDNPLKDHITATPISWKDNQAVVVFNGMRHFDNVDTVYMFSRLKPLVEKANGDGTIDLTPNNGSSMFVFGHEADSNLNYVLNRNNIILTGHNVMFDGKVFYDNGVKPYWDNDTLQQGFDINPKVGKAKIDVLEWDTDESGNKINPHIEQYTGGVGLKNLTRRFFKHETPELTELLGRGMEGCYHEISVEELAIIYGCADADYSRQLFPTLKALMPPGMWERYQRQDIPLLNILYPSEYYGLLFDQDKAEVLRDNAKKNLDILHEFLMEYVGNIEELRKQLATVALYKSKLSEGESNFTKTDLDYILQLIKSKQFKFNLINDHTISATLALRDNEISKEEFLEFSLDIMSTLNKDIKITKARYNSVVEFIRSGSYPFSFMNEDTYNLTVEYLDDKLSLDDLKMKSYDELKLLYKNKHVFTMKPADKINVLYNILRYPILEYTSAEDPSKRKPKVDKKVLAKLASVGARHPFEQIKSDIMDCNGKNALISAKDFNSLEFPVALVLQKYSEIEKEYTSYYNPIVEGNMEGRIFKAYSMARIETRRIMNPLQTMKFETKKLVIPFDGGKDYYMCDFDMAQVEYRIMVSLASIYLGQLFPQFKGRSVADLTDEEVATLTEEEQTMIFNTLSMVERLRDPEKDFHTESAAMLSGTKPHMIDKKFRKRMKAIHFGIPYGLGIDSLCETMFGKKTEVNKIETRKLHSAFCEKNPAVINMLEHYRDEALKPRSFTYDFKKFAGFIKPIITEDGELVEHECKVGMVQNAMGFYRLFNLDDLDKRSEGIIRRAAGNYPIQAFAAELFRIILIRFYNRCVKEGIEDKIIWHMLIHDELLLSVHKSINPFFLYKIIFEECMITIKDHTRYFVGINMDDNWGSCKDDANEAPVLFVYRMKQRYEAGEFKDFKWVDNVREYIEPYIHDFRKTRIHEVLEELEPDIDSKPIDMELIYQDMENYHVRAYLPDFFVPDKFRTEEGSKQWKKWSKAGTEESDRTMLYFSMAHWASEYYGEDKEILGYDGNLMKVSEILKDDVTQVNLVTSLDLDALEEEDVRDIEEDNVIGGFDLADEDEFNDYLETLYFKDNSSQLFKNDDLPGYSLSTYIDDKGIERGLIIEDEPEFKYVSMLNDQICINARELTNLVELKRKLQPYRDDKGISVIFDCEGYIQRWIKVRKDIEFKVIEKFVSEEVS